MHYVFKTDQFIIIGLKCLNVLDRINLQYHVELLPSILLYSSSVQLFNEQLYT